LSDPIHSARLKIERAKKHLADLDAELTAFKGRHPYSIVCQDEGNKRRYIFKVREPLPESLPLLIGDLVHNLRIPLDYLIQGAVRVNHRQPTRRTGFPFAGGEKSFRKALIGAVDGASKKTRAIVRYLKPYGGGNSAVFAIDELDVADKHSTIIPVWSAYTHMRIVPTIPDQPQIKVPFYLKMTTKNAGKIVKDGDTLETVIFHGEGDHGMMDRDLQFAIQISFGGPEILKGKALFPALPQLVQVTERIVDIFDRRIFNPR
jgi:hypothetical protein